MSTIPADAPPVQRLARALNSACQCIWLDRAHLDRRLQQVLGDAASTLASRAGLAAGSVVFLDPEDARSMDRTASLVEQALASPAYRRRVEERAAPIARLGRATSGFLLGFDFHLGGELPQLIEVNTNPGGLLVNLELARALTACCESLTEPVEQMAAGAVGLDQLPGRISESFLAELSRARREAGPGVVAIVDDEPAHQYLYPEFLLYQRLLEQAGWRARIVDAAALEYHDGALWAGTERVDLVYNRLTDFYLVEPGHAALRHAYESGAVVVAPNPADHARWADKRLLAWLREEALLAEAGLGASDREHVLNTIPPTEIVTPAGADSLWKRRKQLFFKPVDGYGGKAAYRGDKLTRTTFEHIVHHRYVAQAVAPTSSRRVVVAGEQSDLHVDVRNYRHQGDTWLRSARLYRGQTTNFRTPGGGFAPVLTLPG